MTQTIANTQECAEFLAAHPDLTYIDLLLSDQHGVLRGKRISANALSKVYKKGIYLPGSVFALDINGNTVEATGIGFDTGDCDQLCRPLANTLMPIPWHEQARAQCLLTMQTADQQPYFANPRHVLDKVLASFSSLGLTPVVAIELEFYLTDPERVEGLLQAPKAPNSGERSHHTQVYAIDDLDAYDTFIDAVMLAAQVQNIPASTVSAEYAPGQFEVNLNHFPDPLTACDHALALKRLIKNIAKQQGFEATFMAKPFNDQAGNGLHIHMSLLNEAGENVFAHPEQNDYLTKALAGLQDTMASSMGLLCPKNNSFKRFAPGFFVPMAATWGLDNRTVALRIPNSEVSARRIEHRVAGADANPYLAMATVLAGTHYGLTHTLNLAAQVTGNAPKHIKANLPLDWLSAQRHLQQSQWAQDYFGSDFLHVYQAVQEAEYQSLTSQVSPLEVLCYASSL